MNKRFAIIDSRAEEHIAAPLKDLGYEVLSLPPFSMLDEPVSAHPDMLTFIWGKKIITHKEYYPIARNIFETLGERGYEIILSEQKISPKYPHDVPLNCAIVGDFLIANEKTVSELILGGTREKLSLLHTNQGYTKCSTFVVDDRSVITADASIARVCEAAGIDVLRIREGDVRLDGYDYGFIGGAGGIDGDRVFFAGDPTYHPDGNMIKFFCESRGKKVIALADTPLFDVGTIFFA